MQSIFDSNKDDILVSESGYQMFDLIPTVKLGPIGRINISIQDCVFKNNYGGKLTVTQEIFGTIF